MSLQRYLRKLRLLVRGRPRSARDVVADYDEYLRLQREDYLSHEGEVPEWTRGLERFIRLAFESLPRESRVLDCACGDGVGLEVLRRLGFEDPVGVELAADKARRAEARGFRIEETDMHDLSAFPDEVFEAILCSHTLEHAYAPGRVLDEFRRLLTPRGRLHVVLPFPDPGTRNERAHTAKYELGTDLDDDGVTVCRYFEARGFEIESCRADSVRESELWLLLRKATRRTGGSTSRSPGTE